MSGDLKEAKRGFENGATRSQTNYRFDLIPAIAEMKVALRFGIGAQKHGEQNWKGGSKEFIKATISHLCGHITCLKRSGQTGDDNIGAVLCNASMLAWFEYYKPEEFLAAIKELSE